MLCILAANTSIISFQNFLAAMSSSRSYVRSFVRVSVRSCFRPSPFFSFSVLEVSSSPKEFQWCFKAV